MIRRIFISAFVLMAIAMTMAISNASSVYADAAADCKAAVGGTKYNLQQGAGLTSCDDRGDANDTSASLKSKFKAISNTLVYITGAVAVIVMIIGGIRYVTSQGNNDQVKQAKDTILYGIIGVIVAIMAYAIVTFVSTQIG